MDEPTKNRKIDHLKPFLEGFLNRLYHLKGILMENSNFEQVCLKLERKILCLTFNAYI